MIKLGHHRQQGSSMSKPSPAHVRGPAVGMAAAQPGIRVLLEGWLGAQSVCQVVQWGFPYSQEGTCSVGFPGRTNCLERLVALGRSQWGLIPQGRDLWAQGVRGVLGAGTLPVHRTSPPAACCSQQSSHLNPAANTKVNTALSTEMPLFLC